MKQLYTVGHSIYELEDFVSLLKKNNRLPQSKGNKKRPPKHLKRVEVIHDIGVYRFFT